MFVIRSIDGEYMFQSCEQGKEGKEVEFETREDAEAVLSQIEITLGRIEFVIIEKPSE